NYVIDEDNLTWGETTYTVRAYNEHGAGLEASASDYVCYSFPLPPENVVVVETENEGEVTISWTAPATDEYGKPLDPNNITYYITKATAGATYPEMVASDITETSYTFQAVGADEGQKMLRFNIGAISNNCWGIEYGTGWLALGPAYTVPYAESFGDFGGKYCYSYYTGCVIIYNESFCGGSQDQDNAFAALIDRMETGKISISEGKAEMSFWYYALNGGENTINVEVNDGTGFQTIGETYVTGPEEGWKRAVVDLEAYSGKTVRIAFCPTLINNGAVCIDNIRIESPLDYDLEIRDISMPKQIVQGETFEISAKLINNGMNTASDFAVDLYRDGELVQTVQGEDVEPYGNTVVKFQESVSDVSFRSLTYYAKINWDVDRVNGNNETEQASIYVKPKDYPAVTDLVGTSAPGAVTLTWSEPDCSKYVVYSTDDFEAYESYGINNAGDWTFIDVDDSSNGKAAEAPTPVDGQKMAYMVFDNTCVDEDAAEFFVAHTGNKYMAAYVALESSNDDWLISPELCGKEQLVSFWAKSVSPFYSESFEFLYSTTENGAEDFTLLEAVNEVPADWTEYSYILPEGAKYFAIRCVSSDKFIFAVDDVTYSPSGGALTVLGYNIYRDDVKVNDEPVDATTYVDDIKAGGNHVYTVKVVYNHGESKVSNAVTLDVPSGVEVVNGNNVMVRSGHGCIGITNAEDMHVLIAGVDSRIVFSGKVGPEARIEVPAGVYLVKVDALVAKVLVK
ncbi:MAG: choice-of-anchor J domain-containing protein, partial [Muribaculaceae bacterium]